MKKLLLTAFLVVALCAVSGVSAESNYSFREDYDAIDDIPNAMPAPADSCALTSTCS